MKKGEEVVLTREQRVEFLSRTREARTMVLRDSESFHLAVCVIEHIGQAISGAIRGGLKHYEVEILNLIAQHTSHDWTETLPLFDLIRQARNDSVHGGAYIRQHTAKLNQLLVMLDEALMADLLEAKDLMVATPVFVQPWQQVAEIRRLMLANSFSYIPVVDLPTNPNAVVSEVALAKMLCVGSTDRRTRMSLSLIDAIQQDILKPEDAPTCTPTTKKRDILSQIEHLPTLVKENGRLVGIITAFDIL